MQRDSECTTHSTGQLAEHLNRHPCVSLSRELYSTRVGKRAAVVSVAVLTLGDARAATAAQQIVDRQRGNLRTLLAEGHRYRSAPRSISDAARATATSGTTVTVVLADYTTGSSSRVDRGLVTSARRALALAQ